MNVYIFKINYNMSGNKLNIKQCNEIEWLFSVLKYTLKVRMYEAYINNTV